MPDPVYRIRPADGTPAGAIVLMHGRGADEHDLGPLLDVLDPGSRMVGVFPRGPLSLPPGGAHWYVVPRVGYPDPDTFFSTMAQMGPFLDGLPRITGVPWERTIIGGFSQGAVMSYALGLGAGRPSPLAIIGLSGFIPTVEGFRVDLDSRPGLPVAIGHGVARPGDQRRVLPPRARPADRGRARRHVPRGRLSAHHRPGLRAAAA